MKPFPVMLLFSCLALVACKPADQPESEEAGDVSAAESSLPDDYDGLELLGRFRYMADAAWFQDCSDYRSYPVSMEGAYKELESQYLNSGIEAGSELLVQLNGRYLERPRMEGNRNEVKLIVDKVNAISPDIPCEPTVNAELIGTYWKLIEVDGSLVTLEEGQREPHIILKQEDSKINGLAGCNNFFGNFRLEGNSLAFSPIGVTRKGCDRGMDIESSFLRALSRTNRHSVDGEILSLYDGQKLVARLESVYL